jgi:hypothetical protein
MIKRETTLDAEDAERNKEGAQGFARRKQPARQVNVGFLCAPSAPSRAAHFLRSHLLAFASREFEIAF